MWSDQCGLISQPGRVVSVVGCRLGSLGGWGGNGSLGSQCARGSQCGWGHLGGWVIRMVSVGGAVGEVWVVG